MTTILGIETSCDETAAAVVIDGRDVRSNIVASQVELHRKYGGVVPEIASRAHIECFDAVIHEAMTTAGVTPADIDAIAVTNRPGLVGSLLIGVTAAKTLAWVWDKPLIAVDHVLAHAISPSIGVAENLWPAVGLIVSGGHTSLYRVTDFLSVELLGSTIDDAAGEAFDKVAMMLGLPYPGGPSIQRAADGGDPKAVDFPRTLLDRDSLDFSFSGIKTAVLYTIHGKGKTSGGLETMSPQRLADICASFQAAVVDVLVKKTMRAVAQTGATSVVIGGGVAANKALREALTETCADRNLRFAAAPMPYCVDNGAMIAALGYHLHQRNQYASLDLAASGTTMRS
ncbi:MAG: tRNA (adenosine(37)-N6)-threonylcarbamoyltransferase complex transferase subunit TsaD [Phycisphaerales bacterium]|nr:tRNA (adenosine(37)-N6)-threonylcarbamoyltransferase complex transferase subunit TsaD [Phycisphaerales bacterium]